MSSVSPTEVVNGPHRLYERKRTLVLHREGGLSSLLEADLWLRIMTFDIITPNADRPASFVPGPWGEPHSSRTPRCFATELPP